MVVRDRRSPTDPRFSERVMRSYEATGLERSLKTPSLAFALDPDFAEAYTQFVRGDLYARDTLSQADREIVACCVLACLDKQDQLASHLRSGISHGATPTELLEAIFQSVPYGGFPAGLSSMRTYAKLFPEMVREDRQAPPQDVDALPSGPRDAGARAAATDFYGPDGADRIYSWLAALDTEASLACQRFIYGGILARDTLEPRMRALAGLGCLVVLGGERQLPLQIRAAARVGASRAEIVETILQMCVYAGWPRMFDAIAVLADLQPELC